MKKVCIVFVLAAVLLGTVASAEQAERKGFLIGLGPKVGYEMQSDIKKVSGGMELRIGGGINEKFLLYYEGTSMWTRKDGVNLYFYDTLAKAQYFVYEDLYVNAGGGWSIGRAEYSGLAASKNGWVANGGVGYEFRLTDKFFLAPEAQFTFRRINGYNFNEPSAMVHCGWYF